MISERVHCDALNCTTSMEIRGVLPDSWVVFDGQHYCSPGCAVMSWKGDLE
jgi:hypothetical protein